MPVRQGVETDRHGGAHDVARQRLTDADGVAAHEVLLQLARLVGRDVRRGELAEAGRHAVDDVPARDDVDDVTGQLDALTRGVAEAHLGVAARHGHDVVDGERASPISTRSTASPSFWRPRRPPHTILWPTCTRTKGAHAEATTSPIVRATPPARRRIVIIAIVLILAVSAGLRLWRLDFPAEFMFDEVYYAKDAKAIVEGRVGTDGPLRWAAGDAVSWPHPEIGKLSIAAGIALFGDRAIGWRLPAVLAGMIILACIYPLARRCGLSPPWAIVALLFAAADPLGITQSRIATLDIFVATWTVVCLLMALRYVQDGRQLRWLLLSGVAGGLALATKWSGVLALLAAGLLVFGAWLCEWRRGRALERASAAASAAEAPETSAPPDAAAPPAAGRPSSPGRRLLGAVLAALPVVVAFVLLPAIVYAASYTQYFIKGHTLADWWELHRQMYTFGMNLHAKHSYASIAPSWIIDYRPVWYYFKGTTEYRGVVAIGNPFLWWTATLALVVAPVAALLRHKTALLLPAAFVAVLYLPWFATTRTSFLYYMTPVAPFLAILVAVALAQFAGRQDLPRLNWLVLCTVAAAAAVFWIPVGRLIEWLFWQLPRQVSPTLGWVAIGVGALLAGLGVIALFSRRLRRRRPLIAVVVAGLIIGIVVAFLPVVLAIPISQEYFSRITWFPSWI